MNDREKKLVEMVLAGKTEAFEPLVLPYRTSLFNIAYRMTGNMEDAKEAAQEPLMKAFKYLKRFDPERRIYFPWVEYPDNNRISEFGGGYAEVTATRVSRCSLLELMGGCATSEGNG